MTPLLRPLRSRPSRTTRVRERSLRGLECNGTIGSLFALLLLPIPAAAQEPLLTASGKPAEADIAPFLGEPAFDSQTVFAEDGSNVREPYLAIALDGTLLAIRNNQGQLRRSEDGGESWGKIIKTGIAHSDSNLIVDETTGDILSLRLWDKTDRAFRSSDHGRTWREEEITVQPGDELRKREKADGKRRGAKGVDEPGTYYLHANASESGVTLRHGEPRGRLVISATFRPHAEEHPSDRRPGDEIFSCALFSDDGGKNWNVSEFFPDPFTEEAALLELHDGRLYFNSRSHRGFYDKALARDLVPEDKLRREAWSEDGGNTWKELRISRVLPDGGGYDRGYGMKGGLTRLPVEGKDVLLFSNADTAGGDRARMTVWASFDGGQTWPVKRLVYESFSAYSSMVAGRPETSTEGMVFLLFEGGPKGRYSAMQVARFNLSWVLEGERTGDGEIPEWVR